MIRRALALAAIGAALIGGAGCTPAQTWDVRYEDGSVEVHYAADVAEDSAGDMCDARGGTMVDDPRERFVCAIGVAD